MSLTITDVITATTAAEIQQEILTLCATGGLPTTAWQSGSVVSELIAIISQEIATKSTIEVQIASGGFGDLTQGAWAQLWAQAIYNVLFIPASSAAGLVTLTNASASIYSLNPGDLIVANKTTGYTYRNQASLTLAAAISTTVAVGSTGAVFPGPTTLNVASTTSFASSGVIWGSTLGSVTYTGKTSTSFTGCSGGSGTVSTNDPVYQSTPNVAISSDQLGSQANANPGDISTMVSSLVGVTVTNPLAVLGTDQESTAALVARTRNKLGSFSPNGPRSAYDYVATTPLNQFPAVAGVTLTATSTAITRSKTTADPTTGFLTVYIATASGGATSPDVALVQLGFNTWAEPWCVTATAASASNLVIPVTYQVWLKSSLTSAQVQSAITTSLAAYFASIPVGGFTGDGAAVPNGAVYVEEITAVIRGAVPNVQRVVVSAPTADVTVTPSQVPVLGTVTASNVFFV